MKKFLLLVSTLVAFNYAIASNGYEQKLYLQLKEISAAPHRDKDFPIYAKDVAHLTQILDQYNRGGGEDQHLQMASDQFLKALNFWAKAKLAEQSQAAYAQNMQAVQASLKAADSQILLYEKGQKAARPH